MIEVFQLAGPRVILLDELVMFARQPDDARLSVGLSGLLIAACGVSLVFSLKTRREIFSGTDRREAGEAPWPLGLALTTLAGVTVLVALVNEVFVGSVQQAAAAFWMTPRIRGFHCRGAGGRCS
jgi:Ca2+:H+ antiporter